MNRVLLLASFVAACVATACDGGATTYSSDPAANQVANDLSGRWALAIGQLCPMSAPGAIDITTVIASPSTVNGGGTWSCDREQGPFAVTVTLAAGGWSASADFYRTGAVSVPAWKATGDYAPRAMSGLVDMSGDGGTIVWSAQHRQRGSHAEACDGRHPGADIDRVDRV